MIRKYKRIVAVFLLVNFITSIVQPTVSWALTAGPTAPEATSFEPVDTTDMVNLATGDLVYNIPLLEVPGPSGGYPLALSYHAGIQPNEESSWIGLGWNINPGAITRNVNGFADDQKDVTNTTRQFWEGGSTTTISIGVTAGISGVAGPTAGLSFSYDTYQGFGIGSNAGVMFKLGNIGAEASIGVSPHGGANASVSAGLKFGEAVKDSYQLSTRVSVSTNFETVDGNVGVSVSYVDGKEKQTSLIGASISTRGTGNFSALSYGTSGVLNSKAGSISSSSIGFTVPIPFISLGFSYQRYWIDETSNVVLNGAIYNPTSPVTEFDEKAFDSYSLLDPTISIAENPDPDKVLGGSFLNYDNYSVNAQGVGGYMRPYSFKNLILRQNKKENGRYRVKQFPYDEGYRNEPFQFRFIGEFSNRFLGHWGTLADAFSGSPLTPIFYNDEVTGENGDDGIMNGHLVGSKHIEYYTNNQILGNDNTKNPAGEGFMDTRASGFVRSNEGSLGSQIGGFKITNESGVTYHFALPVYAFKEYQYSENINRPTGHTFNELKRDEKYAYTWYLTAVTGPDFVDRGPEGVSNGTFDEYDWGYWVEFEYGMWTDSYIWRNPSTGFHKDIDENFQNFSTGVKEVYYLDAIRTRTHTALFIKELRDDGKGIAVPDKPIFKNKDAVYSSEGKEGFIPGELDVSFEYGYSFWRGSLEGGDPANHTFVANPGRSANNHFGTVACRKTYKGIFKPVSLLKLKSIKLFSNEDLKDVLTDIADLKKRNEILNHANEYQFISAETNNTILETQNICSYDGNPNHLLASLGAESLFVDSIHLGNNVLTVNNVNGLNLESTQLRSIEFSHDYSLCPETKNSFSNENLYENYQPITRELKGKLTLNDISFLGKGGANSLPPMVFGYAPQNPSGGEADLQKPLLGQYFFLYPDAGLVEGDLIEFQSASKVCYALIRKIEQQDANMMKYTLKILGKKFPEEGRITFVQTKNPPYNDDSYDMWGFYKSDFKKFDNENLSRLTTEVSSRNVDAWSLTNIRPTLGSVITLEYESDKYHKSALNKANLLTVKSMNYDTDDRSISFEFYGESFDLQQIKDILFKSKLTVLIARDFRINNDPDYCTCWCGSVPFYDREFLGAYYEIKSIPITESNLVSVSSNGIKIKDEIVYSDLYNRYAATYTESQCIDKNYHAYDIPIYVYEGLLIGGNLVLDRTLPTFGGGLRVKSVKLQNPLYSEVNRTSYEYENGVTSYEPVGFGKVALDFDWRPEKPYDAEENRIKRATNDYKNLLYLNFSRLLAVSREVPPPGVVYGNVTVSESVTGKDNVTHFVPGRVAYQFEVFDENNAFSIGGNATNTPHSTRNYDNVSYTLTKSRHVDLRDLTARVGLLKSITIFDGNNNKVSETINHFLHDNLTGNDFTEQITDYADRMEAFKSQGVLKEVLLDARFVKGEDGEFSLVAVGSHKTRYPVIQTGQTSRNYKTGITTTTNNLAFNFYSGEAVKISATDGYGNEFVTETTPAYKIFPAMGPAADGGFNMLIQKAATYTYKVDSEKKPIGLASAGVQTWSNKVDILDTENSSHLMTLRSTSNLNIYEMSGNPGQENVFNQGDRVLFTVTTTVKNKTIVTEFPAMVISKETPLSYRIKIFGNSFLPAFFGTIESSVSKLFLYRKHKSYSFIGNDEVALGDDGLYSLSDNRVPYFTSWKHDDNAPLVWQKKGEITLYDVHSHALEAKDINGNFAATKMSSDKTQVFATVANGQYKEFAYSGAEDALQGSNLMGGDVTYQGTITTTSVHTGSQAVSSSSGQKSFLYAFDPEQRFYHVSVWSNKPTAAIKYKLDGGAEQTATLGTVRKAEEWYLIEATIDLTGAHETCEVWCTPDTTGSTIFDDFRIHPVDAAMTSYVYNQWGELSHILDANNLYTEYRYDEMGRLKETITESFGHGRVTTGRQKYHYSGQ